MDFIPNEQLRLLVQIQEIDSKIIEITEKQKGLPEIIASLQINLDKARSDLAEAVRHLEDANKERRVLEGELKDSEEKIRKLKGRIPEIKTNKEYQALLKEIELAEKEKSELEEKILILLEKIDDGNLQRTEREKIVREEEIKFLDEKEKVEKDFHRLSERLEELGSLRNSVSSQIEPKLFSEYNRLLSSRKGLAVVAVQNEHCLGCHIRIPPQVFTEIRKNEKIINCLNCQRILYWIPQGR